MSKLKYEIREGTDMKWGIYSTAYNLRIAEFYPNTEADRKQIKEMIQENPEITEEWIEEKGLRIACKYGISQVQARKIIRSLVEPMPVKKATVDEDFVKHWNQIIAERVNVQMKKDFIREEISLVYPGTENLTQMLKEAGVEVIKNE